MRGCDHIFHLAIPCESLDEAKAFYGSGLGCEIAREYNDRITINFFGGQVVCHLSPESIDKKPTMYPRHFGITFCNRLDFDSVYLRAQEKGLEFFHDLFSRFEGEIEEHSTFFLKDPSNNLLEFKYYIDRSMVY